MAQCEARSHQPWGWGPAALMKERARTKSLKISAIESVREKLLETIRIDAPPQIGQVDDDVSTVLPEKLPAGSAGRRHRVGSGDDG